MEPTSRESLQPLHWVNLSTESEVSVALVNQDALGSLVSLLSVGNEYQSVYAARTLGNIAEHTIDFELWSQTDVLRALSRLERSGTECQKTAAAHALALIRPKQSAEASGEPAIDN